MMNLQQITEKLTMVVAATTGFLIVSCGGTVASENQGLNSRQFVSNNSHVNQKVGSRLQDERPEWRKAIYHGLAIGKAKIAEIEPILGKPTETADLKEVGSDGTVAFHYESLGEMAGKVIVYVKKKTQKIMEVEVRPDAMTRAEVVKLFGSNYVLTKYSFDTCLGDGDSSPFFESRDGEIEFMEYREKGIAIAFLDDSDKVQYISYLGKPIGNVKSQCK